jgi:hypothetical protein
MMNVEYLNDEYLGETPKKPKWALIWITVSETYGT